MKKILFLLGLVAIALIITPQVSGIDKDVGYSIFLPADHNAVVSTDCQEGVISQEYVSIKEIRDTGSRVAELRVQTPGLRAEELIISSAPPPGGYICDMLTNYQTQESTRLINELNRQTPFIQTASTSNGGAGY
jgi:hypothetical protein